MSFPVMTINWWKPSSLRACALPGQSPHLKPSPCLLPQLQRATWPPELLMGSLRLSVWFNFTSASPLVVLKPRGCFPKCLHANFHLTGTVISWELEFKMNTNRWSECGYKKSKNYTGVSETITREWWQGLKTPQSLEEKKKINDLIT
jgi:hypothetical protein